MTTNPEPTPEPAPALPGLTTARVLGLITGAVAQHLPGPVVMQVGLDQTRYSLTVGDVIHDDGTLTLDVEEFGPHDVPVRRFRVAVAVEEIE